MVVNDFVTDIFYRNHIPLALEVLAQTKVLLSFFTICFIKFTIYFIKFTLFTISFVTFTTCFFNLKHHFTLMDGFEPLSAQQ